MRCYRLFPAPQLFCGLVCAFVTTGCAELELPDWVPSTTPSATAQSSSEGPIPVSGARTADQLDTASAADRAQATSVGSAGGRLGTTIATLGAATEPGFWLKTPLVTSERSGVLRSRDTGKTVSVTLIPIDGPSTAGSRISLSAMRSLELPLTALAELDVSSSG